MQIVAVCTAVKIQEQQPGPRSALGGSHQVGTLHPGVHRPRAQTHPSDLPSPPRAAQSVFRAQSIFRARLATEPRCREPQRGLCVASARRHAAGQVEVLPRECQELFLGKPWPLPSGMGGKEPLT